VRHPSLPHPRQAAIRAVDPIDLRVATSPPIQEEVDQNNPKQPRVNGAKDDDLRASLDKNRRARNARDYID
jgi:hypothetical protein